MKIVETATDQPGICALSGTDRGPFVELDRLLSPELAHGGTCYVNLDVLKWLTAAVLPVEAQETQATIERLTRERDEARDAHHELLQCVGTTLQHGAIVRQGKIELRKPYDRMGRIITKSKGGGRPVSKR